MPSFRPIAKHPEIARAFDVATDLFERVFFSKGPLTPPLRIRKYVGPFLDPRAYERSANLQVEGLLSHGLLSTKSKVLDVGCGTGRMAAALTRILGEEGCYEGIDPQPTPIQWCDDHVSPAFPHFRFRQTETFSEKYNPGGTHPPEGYRFPFRDKSFDLVLLLSVVTHVPREVEERLVEESARVLANDGRIFLTEYLLDRETRPRALAGETSPRFAYAYGEDRCQTPGSPEGFVARDDEWARSTWKKHSLSPVAIHPGTWAHRRGSSDPFSDRYSFFQDAVVLGRS